MDTWTAITLIAIGAVGLIGVGIILWIGTKEYRRTYNNNEEGKHDE